MNEAQHVLFEVTESLSELEEFVSEQIISQVISPSSFKIMLRSLEKMKKMLDYAKEEEEQHFAS